MRLALGGASYCRGGREKGQAGRARVPDLNLIFHSVHRLGLALAHPSLFPSAASAVARPSEGLIFRNNFYLSPLASLLVAASSRWVLYVEDRHFGRSRPNRSAFDRPKMRRRTSLHLRVHRQTSTNKKHASDNVLCSCGYPHGLRQFRASRATSTIAQRSRRGCIRKTAPARSGKVVRATCGVCKSAPRLSISAPFLRRHAGAHEERLGAATR